MEPDREITSLVCEECGREADPQGVGWRAYLGVEEDKDGVMVGACVVVICPECAEQEFEQR